ncbi:hypothetical protein FD754_015021 [Muntiacus muntjak]|uniref:UPAR/Ly6 domain-containing protein n=1 Tax=Muntiacus muntjak TaxID=9888 RepID=A0A5N3VM23_MUNMU|nr:hypothetical protein FD754_015021 [Muntiacus muntjak]
MKPETFLLASALLCTLLGLAFALGCSLSCEVCVSDGPNCNGKLQTCAPDKDSCIVVVTESNRKGSVDVTSYKGCAKSSECDPAFLSITMALENYMGSDTRCCQNDGTFRRNLTENGLRCPSCFSVSTETCTPTQEALCVGEETCCVTLTGLMHPGIRFAAQGCGTEAACHSKPGTLVPSGSRLLTIEKTSSRPSPQASGKAE